MGRASALCAVLPYVFHHSNYNIIFVTRRFHHVQVCLCGFRQLKDEDVQLLLDSCPYLTALSVGDCTSLGTLVLVSPSLRTLDVSRCIHISEMCLEMPGELRERREEG